MFPTKLSYLSNDEMTEFVINDRATQPNLWGDSPYFYINAESVDNLRGADISSESHPLPNFIGEYSGDVIRRGKTVTITGKITALSLAALEQGADYLQEMFTESSRRKLVWSRWADGITVYLKCRVNQDLVIVESIDSEKYEYSYTVGLRADDPRTKKFSDNTVYPEWQE